MTDINTNQQHIQQLDIEPYDPVAQPPIQLTIPADPTNKRRRTTLINTQQLGTPIVSKQQQPRGRPKSVGTNKSTKIKSGDNKKSAGSSAATQLNPYGTAPLKILNYGQVMWAKIKNTPWYV